MKVDVCVVSYRRPRGLLRTLSSLQAIRLPRPEPELRVLVLDNDPEESAREACAEAERWLRFPLVYAVEKRRGIPQARNAALALSLEHADLVAFLDDDEEPDPGWLTELLSVRSRCDADAVAGPVLPVFEEPPPSWILRGRLFEPPRHATGARLGTAATGNVLVATRALAALDRLFDERMALTGGSDDELFQRFARAGHSIVWADEAIVREWVPPSRATLRWILRRSLRVGTCTALVDRRLRQPPLPAWRHLGQAVWCVAKGALLALASLPRGRGPAVARLRLAAFGLGRLGGLLGLALPEYRAVHRR